jgi:hypothetical protein
MQALESHLLMQVKVAGWVESDASSAVSAIAPDPQGNLLSHGASGEEDGGFFTQ